MQYTVVTSKFANRTDRGNHGGASLEEKVEQHLAEGWKLQGGVSVGNMGDGARNELPFPIYAQALVRD